MTATFLLPLAIGATEVIHSSSLILTNAYGLIATVAMMPLITIQILGLTTRLKTRKKKTSDALSKIKDEEIIEFK